MQSDGKIQSKLLFLMIVQISLLIIVVLLPCDVNAQTLHNQTLEEKVREMRIVKDNPQISVGDYPSYIEIVHKDNLDEGKIYVANTDSDTVSVISAKNNTKITDIPVGKRPNSIGVTFDKVYVANIFSDSVSVISVMNNTKIGEGIVVGEGPNAIGRTFNVGVGEIPRVIGTFDKIYVANSNADTISVISAVNDTKIADIPVGKGPIAIHFTPLINKLYVANADSDTVSVILPRNDTKIADIPDIPISLYSNSPHIIDSTGSYSDLLSNKKYYKVYIANADSDTVTVISAVNDTKIADIPVGKGPIAIGSTTKSRVYVANSGSDTVSLISAVNDTKIADIPVGEIPTDIEFNSDTNTLYVANSGSDTVSVISTENNTKITDIPVGEIPTDIEFNSDTNTLYVANSGSNGISVIDGETNKVVAGVKFNIYPPNSGNIKCNDLNFPLNQFLYVSSECKAKPNKGFEFISWIENLENNSNRTIQESAEGNYILKSLYDVFGYKPDDPAASLFQFGDYTANFKALPPPIPSEYLIPLYGIIITTIVGWSIPSIINWIRTKSNIKTLSYYHKEIISIYNDGKLDEKDFEHLNVIKNSISNDYSKGKLNERHYESLQNEISISYEEIFKKRIDSSINESSTNKEDKKKQFNKINEDIEDAYSKEKITEKHYNLLKEKISELENKK